MANKLIGVLLFDAGVTFEEYGKIITFIMARGFDLTVEKDEEGAMPEWGNWKIVIHKRDDTERD